MKRNKLKGVLVALTIGLACTSQAQSWETIATDDAGDGASGTLLDGREFEYWYDESEDSLWFRLTCTAINEVQSADFGFNIMVNYPGGGTTFDFWGADNDNPYHKLITGWVTGTPPSSYSGTVGIASGAGVLGADYTNLFSDNLSIVVDVSTGTIVVGMHREDLIPDAALEETIAVAAAVGSSSFWNDDIHSASGTMVLTDGDVGGLGESNSAVETLDLYPNPAKDQILLSIPAQLNGANVFIHDLSGRLWLTSFTNSGQININDLPTGVYSVNAQSIEGDYNAYARFVKN